MGQTERSLREEQQTLIFTVQGVFLNVHVIFRIIVQKPIYTNWTNRVETADLYLV
jgi:hypothetical protein